MASVGELRFLWERGILEQRLCGCGRPFLECPTWSAILLEAFPDTDLPALARRMVDLQQAGIRARRLPQVIRRSSRDQLQRTMSEYLGNLSRLYAVTAAHLGGGVVVDSSKLPAYGAMLEMLPGVDVRVVHLIRDPRATAYSWLRKKALTDRAGTAFMQQQGPVKASGALGPVEPRGRAALAPILAVPAGPLRVVRAGAARRRGADPRPRRPRRRCDAVRLGAGGGADPEPHGGGQSQQVLDGTRRDPRRRRVGHGHAPVGPAPRDRGDLAAAAQVRLSGTPGAVAGSACASSSGSTPR